MAPRSKVSLREMTPEEQRAIEQLAVSRTAPARLLERARILPAAASGRRLPEIAQALNLSRPTVYAWIPRFNDQGPDGLQERPRSGRPHTYTAEQRAEVIATALTDPKGLGLPFGCWTLDRLRASLDEHKGIPMKRSRIDEILTDEGLRWRQQEPWFGARVDPAFAEKRGVIERLSTKPPQGSVVVCLDEMGPESAQSFPGQRLVRADPRPLAVRAEPLPETVAGGQPPDTVGTDCQPGPVHVVTPQPDGEGQVRRIERAQQEIDSGRRGQGSLFGAFRPATGEALTHPYPSRSAANWADFLERVEAWIPAEVERVYALVANLEAHRAVDVLLFAPAFARWEFVFPPKDAAYLNLIEPWWKVLRSLALKGRRFETWEEVCRAVEEATAYGNKHRHPFLWGRRRRHRPRRRPGIASVPGVRRLAG
jgi:transposase